MKKTMQGARPGRRLRKRMLIFGGRFAIDRTQGVKADCTATHFAGASRISDFAARLAADRMRMREYRIVFQAKRRFVANAVSHMKSHVKIHAAIFAAILGLMLGGGYRLFTMIFDYLMSLEVFGPPLMDHLVGMVFMTFFSMLVFSNLVVTLSTAYTSKEVDFLMALPVDRPTIFFVRLSESILYSSWAFALLSLPLLLAFGHSRGAAPGFYAATAALMIPFLLIPASIGALLTMVLSSLFPARKTFRMALLLGALGAAIAILMVRMMGLRAAMQGDELQTFQQVMGILQIGQIQAVPSAWLLEGMFAAEQGDWREYGFWLAMLASSALFALQVCAWLAPRIYYRGWRLAGESSAPRRKSEGAPLMTRLDSLLERFSPPLRAMIAKDIKTFWRDPAQWSQLIVLFGLLFVYVANLRAVSRYNVSFSLDSPFWKTILSFFNMGAACFVLSILTTRFVYPMLSLEGKQFWILGLAPVSRDTMIWEKYWLCWAVSASLTGALTLFSSFILDVSPAMALLSLATVVAMSFALTSISIGLGALTPNFKEDNPARIANGMGGTMNVFLSLIYVGLVIAIEVWPAFLLATGRLGASAFSVGVVALSAAALVALNAAAIVLPMRLGLARWRNLEF